MNAPEFRRRVRAATGTRVGLYGHEHRYATVAPVGSGQRRDYSEEDVREAIVVIRWWATTGDKPGGHRGPQRRAQRVRELARAMSGPGWIVSTAGGIRFDPDPDPVGLVQRGFVAIRVDVPWGNQR